MQHGSQEEHCYGTVSGTLPMLLVVLWAVANVVDIRYRARTEIDQIQWLAAFSGGVEPWQVAADLKRSEEKIPFA